MGKYSKSMRAWSEKQLAQFICEVFDREIQRYTGPAGPPGPMGMQGPPGACQCARPEWWGRPLTVTYSDNIDPSGLDGGRGYTTATEVATEFVRPPQYLYRYYACACTWMGSVDQDPPAYCSNHPQSSLCRKETL
jgi:hypothetical protein